jgi:hypothetical protein
MKGLIYCVLLITVLGCTKEKKQFKESPDTEVFTSTFVLKGHDVLYVSHDKSDGAWQFHSVDNLDNFKEVARIVSLQEIVKLDSSLTEVADMKPGFCAERKSKNSEWIIKERKE